MLNYLWKHRLKIYTLIPELTSLSSSSSRKLFANHRKSLACKNYPRNVLLSYTMYRMIMTEVKDESIEQETHTKQELDVELEDLNEKNGEALMELLHTINFCIIEISQQYKECLEKQIAITIACNRTDQNWDDLIRCRVEAEELKLEFDKYKLLVHKIEHYLFSHAVNSLMNNVDSNVLEDLNQELNTLVSFLENLEKDNKDIEKRLLKAKANSIITGLEEVQ